MSRDLGFLIITSTLLAALPGICWAQAEAPLPPGVKAVWDLGGAFREATPTRERVCVNGLWRWQPAEAAADRVPDGNWGFFKVPGAWPGITDYMQKDFQTLHLHPAWADVKPGDVKAAWYQREITIPPQWAGRRVALTAEYLNSYATVYVDGKKAGEMRFPAGEVDLTSVCRPGGKHLLSLHVVAMPLKAVMLSFGDTNAAKSVPGRVARRGLCGDVWLVGTPAGPSLGDVRVRTSVEKWEITFDAEAQGLAPEASYALRARISDGGRSAAEFTGKPFRAADLKEGRIALTEAWKPQKLWDLHTPGNQVDLTLSLLDAGGKALDEAHPVRFGFRELRIEGRDFLLNGTRVWLCALPLDNAQVGAALASYEGAKESLLRLKEIGINFVYTHNYGCEPGTHLGFAEILRAADDVGMLVSLSQPHFGQYDWQAPDAEEKNGYARDAAFYARVAGSHPSVVFYSTSHNATGYSDDMNPDLMDGVSDPRESWAKGNAKRALQVEAILNRLDPSRIVYHHSSGNLGSMHTSNFYTNFAPAQELDDWFETWATKSVKPIFTCEYMVPCTWDWTMYRGWYKGTRNFGSATVPWELCVAEWSAQFLGGAAYHISEPEKKNLRWEAEQFRQGRLWHRWDYPHQVGDRVFEVQHEIIGRYLTRNWRAFRTWGVSAISPWEHHFYWTLRDGVDKSRKELKTDWDRLQRPGFSPDFIERRYERRDLAFERADWIPTADGQAILRNNGPLLAYIAGKPDAFTTKDHNFTPGETVEKQLILINNSRATVTGDCRWSLGLPQPLTGTRKVTVETGQQERLPLRFALPETLAPGAYELSATVRFSDGSEQKDTFALHVLPRPAAPQVGARVALFDPKGDTGKLLAGMGVRFQAIGADADLSGYDILIVGKGALTPDGPAPDIRRVRDGLKVLLFEQTAAVLEGRFGFRVQEYGLRQAVKRVPDHPALAGLDVEHLRDWRGDATLTPPRLEYTTNPRLGAVPQVKRCGIELSRVWRVGNRGNVASVLIEKPARGDFLPLLDGGYSLQYTPLMEYREGKGLLLLCQADVTGRTESDPAAETLARSLLGYVAAWQPAPRRGVLYAGDPAGRRHLERAGIAVAAYEGGKPAPDQVLVVGAGGGARLAGNRPAVAEFIKAGGRLLCLGLDQEEANAFLPFKVTMQKAEHIAAFFDAPGLKSPLAGISPADVHNRDPRELPLVSGGATVVGNGVLAHAEGGNVLFCQLPPYEVSKAEGAVPSYVVSGEDAAEGKRCALLTFGSLAGSGGQLGQKVAGGAPGKTYTFAVMAKAVGGPVAAHLEIERPVRPWDRALKAPKVTLADGKWTEMHATFKVEQPFTEGWFAYVACTQEGARLRLDGFRLYEGEYVPGKTATGIAFANPGFEEGADPWRFSFHEAHNLRRTYRRTSYLLTRLLANLGAGGATPVLERFTTPVTGVPRPSVVKNGDFRAEPGKEGLPAPWQLSTDLKQVTCAVEGNAPDGGASVRITSPPAAEDAKASVMLCQHDVPAEQGQWYLISLRAKAEGFTGGQVTLALQNMADWSSLFDYQHFTPTAEWKEFTFLVQAKATVPSRTRFQIWHGGAGTLWLSDIRMAPCDPPTTGRWLDGLYLDEPEEWDDPYRFFRW